MKRTVITMDGNGEFSIPSNLQDLWMIEGELVDMLHVTAPKLHAVIRSMYKEGLFLVSDVQQKKETSKGICAGYAETLGEIVFRVRHAFPEQVGILIPLCIQNRTVRIGGHVPAVLVGRVCDGQLTLVVQFDADPGLFLRIDESRKLHRKHWGKVFAKGIGSCECLLRFR